MNVSMQKFAEDRYPIGTDPVLSGQVRQEFIDTLVARTGIDATKAEDELSQRDVASAFERRFGELGLSRGQLADVLAAHVLAMWSIVHDSDFSDPDIAAAVRTQLAASLRGRPEAVDPVKRQLIGEALIYESMLSLEARDQARAEGDRKQLAQMAETAQRNVLNRQAINLRKTRLTRSGLQRG
jgi:hypothetical protein